MHYYQGSRDHRPPWGPQLTSFVTGALDGITSFLRLKDVTNTCKRIISAGILQCNGGKLEEADDFKCVFVVY